MKIDEHLFRFPDNIPNDFEAFMIFYPKKYPLIVPYYEDVARKIGADAKAYQEYGNWAHDELFAGFEKVKKEYDAGDKDDLAFLVSIDQRLHKLCCFRFWVVNYLFADGPLHDFYVDNLKTFIRKFVDVTEDIEDFEDRVVRMQRDLLQSDYADLYLRQALSGVDVVKFLWANPKTSPLLQEAITLIDKHNHDNAQQINHIWDQVIKIVTDKNDPQNEQLEKVLAVPLEQAEMRSSMLPVYNMLTHAVEFRDENEVLAKRHGEMEHKIDDLMDQARAKLSEEDFELFELSYWQARNFSMYKDVMGEIDTVLLPTWFGVHTKIKEILVKTTDLKPKPTGHSAVFLYLVWYLPEKLKDVVMTPDTTPFSLETL